MTCKRNNKPNKVDIKLHSPFVTMDRYGDLVDLTFCGIDKVFEGEVEVGLVHRDFEHLEGTEFGETHNVQYIKYKKGAIFRVNLGFAMKMPSGKKANVYPRSGTRKNFGVLMTNSVGQIDNKYQGTNDQWRAELYAIQDGEMCVGDRILQFEIVDIQPKIEFNFVDKLDAKDRGGYGSSGIR